MVFLLEKLHLNVKSCSSASLDVSAALDRACVAVTLHRSDVVPCKRKYSAARTVYLVSDHYKDRTCLYPLPSFLFTFLDVETEEG